MVSEPVGLHQEILVNAGGRADLRDALVDLMIAAIIDGNPGMLGGEKHPSCYCLAFLRGKGKKAYRSVLQLGI